MTAKFAFAYSEEFGKPTAEDNWPQILAMFLNSQGLILAELVNEIVLRLTGVLCLTGVHTMQGVVSKNAS
jgi:hypothetical protein